MGEELETGVPLDKGHVIIMLMAEDKPLWTEQVDLPGLNPMVWAQGRVVQEKTVPSPLGGLVGHLTCYTGPNWQGPYQTIQSAWSTPILPVKKPNGEYLMV